jgi:hypothetical protein
LVIKPITDERVPAGSLGLGAFLGDRLIARNTFPEELVEKLPLTQLFAEPVPLLFQAGLGGPGIQGTLFAVVPAGPIEDSTDEEAEPWAASVPRYEDAIGEPEQLQVLFPLGILVRVAGDRKFPADLAREAADLLQTALKGETHEVIDRVLDDLLGP